MSVQLFRKLKHALCVPSGLTRNVSDVFAERKDVDRLQESGEMTFFGQIVTRCYTIVSSPLVSLSLSFSVALFPPCALSFMFPLETESQKWIQYKTHTHFYSSTLWNSLPQPLHPHPPFHVSCFPHACTRLFPVGLFVCGPSSRRTPFSRTLPVFTGPQKSKVQVNRTFCPLEPATTPYPPPLHHIFHHLPIKITTESVSWSVKTSVMLSPATVTEWWCWNSLTAQRL